MTEEEAKTKWCPYSNVVETSKKGNSNPRNRVVLLEDENKVISHNLVGTKCIASDCMMWEPYEYYLDKETKNCYASQDTDKTRVFVCGGGCGLKSKDLDCRGF